MPWIADAPIPARMPTSSRSSSVSACGSCQVTKSTPIDSSPARSGCTSTALRSKRSSAVRVLSGMTEGSLYSTARQRDGAVVEVRAVDGDGGLGRDRDEEVEVAVVVGGRARALRRDRADDGATQPQRCDDDRLLLHRPPRRAVREPERATVALGVAEEERAFALDARAGERPGLHTLDRLELAPVVDEEAVAELLGVAPERRDIEGVRVHDRGDRAVDAAEHLRRVDRAAHRAADLHQGLQQARAAP